MIDRPPDVFDREAEWRALSAFATDPAPGATLGIVTGRRRQGKSFLLDALCEATGGFYHEAIQAEAAESLRPPLRGRAGLELVVPPLDYRQAARFLGIGRRSARGPARLQHRGRHPAYRREFTRSQAPRGAADFDDWVQDVVLDPAVPLLREGRYLLAEDPGLSATRDAPLYHSVWPRWHPGAAPTVPSRASSSGRGLT